MEASLANAGRQVPTHPPQVLGERRQRGMPVGRQLSDSEVGQRGNEAHKGCVARFPSSLQPPIKPEECVPTAIGGEVTGEHEQSEGSLLRLIQESKRPDLRMKNVAQPGSPDSMDDVLEQRRQIGRPSPGQLMAPAWQNMSNRSAHTAQRFHHPDGI